MAWNPTGKARIGWAEWRLFAGRTTVELVHLAAEVEHDGAVAAAENRSLSANEPVGNSGAGGIERALWVGAPSFVPRFQASTQISGVASVPPSGLHAVAKTPSAARTVVSMRRGNARIGFVVRTPTRLA